MVMVVCVLTQGWKDEEIPRWFIPDMMLNNPPLVAFWVPSWLLFCPASSFLLLMGLFEGRKNKQTVTRRKHSKSSSSLSVSDYFITTLGPRDSSST